MSYDHSLYGKPNLELLETKPLYSSWLLKMWSRWWSRLGSFPRYVARGAIFDGFAPSALSLLLELLLLSISLTLYCDCCIFLVVPSAVFFFLPSTTEVTEEAALEGEENDESSFVDRDC